MSSRKPVPTKPLPSPKGERLKTETKKGSKLKSSPRKNPADQDDFWGTGGSDEPTAPRSDVQPQQQQYYPQAQPGMYSMAQPPSPQLGVMGQRSFSQPDLMGNPYMAGAQPQYYYAQQPSYGGWYSGAYPTAFQGGTTYQVAPGTPMAYPGAPYQQFQGAGSFSTMPYGNMGYNPGMNMYPMQAPMSEGAPPMMMPPQSQPLQSQPQQPQPQQSQPQQPLSQPRPVEHIDVGAPGAPGKYAAHQQELKVATEMLQRPPTPTGRPTSNAADAARRNMTPTLKRNILVNQHKFAEEFGAQSLRRKVKNLTVEEQGQRDLRRKQREEKRKVAPAPKAGIKGADVKEKLQKAIAKKEEPVAPQETEKEREDRIKKAVEARLKEQEELMFREVEERVKREEAERRKQWEQEILAKQEEEERKRAVEEARILAQLEEEQRLRAMRESEMKMALEEEKKRRQDIEEQIQRDKEIKMKELEEQQRRLEAQQKAEAEKIHQENKKQTTEKIEKEKQWLRQSFNPETLKRQIEERVREELMREQKVKEEAEANARKNEKFVWEFGADEVTLDKELGRGAFGVVYAGKLHGKRVAVKKFAMGVEVDEDILNSFKVEVDIMNKLRHPNILLFMGACFQPENCMLVTEIMPRGSLDNIIHNEAGTPVPFRLRMRFAKDTVLGMNWLHRLRPPFLHLDLKLGNLLVDENWNVKVADFGLSKIKPDCVEVEGGGLIGSPFYMAPEMLMEKDYGEKADVYSFSICLWEIYTMKFPYEGMFDELDELVMAVGMDEERPEIPADCPATLRDLIESCWHNDPHARPSFKRILKASLFDCIVIEDAIKDEQGRNFWKTKLMDSDTVKFEEFFEEFLEHFNINPLLLPSTSPKVRAFAAVLAPKGNPGQVTLASFGTALESFGPVITGVDFVEAVAATCSKAWFFGELTKEEAELVLSGKRTGAFLVRFSTSAPGSYTLTIQYKKKKFRHLRILRSPDKKGFVYNNKTYKTMDEFLAMHAQQLNMKFPATGSPFSAIFEDKKDKPAPGGVYGSYTLCE